MLREVLLALLGGFGQSLQLFCYTLLGALPLGLVIAFGSMTRWRPLQKAVRGLVWVVRGTPLMLQLIVIYYGPGLLIRDGNLWGGGGVGRMAAAATAFIINYACYFSEIYRGGIESIPRGQYEAGAVLGMTRRQVFFKVVLLQVIKRIVPSMGNEVITLVKDTALARVIGVAEIIMVAERYTKQGLIGPLFSTGLYFLLFNGILTLLLGRIERKMDYFRV